MIRDVRSYLLTQTGWERVGRKKKEMVAKSSLKLSPLALTLPLIQFKKKAISIF